MRKPINFYIANVLARISRRLLLLLGRNATHFPGVVALKICPNILKYLEKPDILIGVTGTNGKTTVTNLIGDILKNENISFVSNSYGSNIVEGIVVTLLSSTKLNGSNLKPYGVFEIDERASIRIFPYLKPDYLVITNLFRDSYRRNAHYEYIRDLIDKYLPEETTLIVNSADTISSFIGRDNQKFVFSVAPLPGETERRDSIINDLYYCPKCDHVLIYDFVRYHHIGKVHCDNCDFKNLAADLVVTAVDYEAQLITVEEKGEKFNYRLIGNNITDIYNSVTAITTLRQLGLTHQTLIAAFKNLEITATRFETVSYQDYKVVRLLAKGQNPVGTSRTLDYIRHNLDDYQATAVIFVNEDYWLKERPMEIENLSWLYDADFEYLNQPNIKQIIIGGKRTAEYQLRFELAGIDKSKLFEASNQMDTIKLLDIANLKTVVILYDTTNIPESKQLQNKILEMFKEVV